MRQIQISDITKQHIATKIRFIPTNFASKHKNHIVLPASLLGNVVKHRISFLNLMVVVNLLKTYQTVREINIFESTNVVTQRILDILYL
jgi:Trk K+ transport system NAD-binding subunit